ncbi:MULTISPECIES: DUF5365 family protein [Bacillaceae]|uniref:DUF5365 family protein n=1 Tax=Bacillaceae TaxID=186817 RepID=UPI002A0AA883|nr:DUF5365 family protein [Cytobacillus sp. IB215316]MDX8362121.1 DUF5365 family protein [Cytobacillus sp. IB215316]
MKVVYASTPEQEKQIEELIAYFYSDIFPSYFTDEEITEMEENNILSKVEMYKHYNGTVKEAIQIITSLQVIIHIIETIQYENVSEYHRTAFKKNISFLEKYSLSFPFQIDSFSLPKTNIISYYCKPNNQFLV